MKASAFDYHAPVSIDEVVALLAADSDAKVLAGGQSLLPMLALRVAHAPSLVDLGGVPGLDRIELVDGVLRIGAMTTQAAALASPAVQSEAPLLAAALARIGHLAIRNRGTVGGSAAHADPAAEIPAVLVCLAAELVVRGAAGERRVAAGSFFRSPFVTTLGPGEVLTFVEIPTGAARWSFHELSRRSGDYALTLVAVRAAVSGGRCDWARIVLGGVAGTPVRATAAEEALLGAHLDDATIGQAAEAAASGLEPPSDVHASSAYRLHLVRVLVRRALAEIAS